MEHNRDIKCSVGILTFNSAKTLERCLKSLDGFGEIIVADGGSTDETLKIAQSFDCKIISQSNPGSPIADFSFERNRILEVAAFDWFFYLDSDETISGDLKSAIRNISSQENPAFLVYGVRYELVSEDLSVVYKSFKPYYQNRFFNRKTGAKFIKKMHERISFDEKQFRVGKIEASWYVPLDIQLDFKIYKSKVEHRLPILVGNWISRNPFVYLRRGIAVPFLNAAKQLYKMLYLRVRYKGRELVPFRYELFRLYSQWVIFREVTKKYFKLVFNLK